MSVEPAVDPGLGKPVLSVEHRLAAIELCLVSLMAEHFKAAADPIGALDAYDADLIGATAGGRAQIVEAAAAMLSQPPDHGVEAAAHREVDLVEVAFSGLLARVRRLLIVEADEGRPS